MEFNLPKYLTENKLTHQSFVREEEDVLDVSPEVTQDEPELDLDEPEDNWNKDDSGDSEDFEKEPSKKDIEEPKELSGIHKKQAELKQLANLKDQILLQYKSGQIGLDQYKELIGNIPQQIKKLKSQIEKAMTVTLDDEEDQL